MRTANPTKWRKCTDPRFHPLSLARVRVGLRTLGSFALRRHASSVQTYMSYGTSPGTSRDGSLTMAEQRLAEAGTELSPCPPTPIA